MPLTLQWLGRTTLPVEASSIQPASFNGRSLAEIARIPIPVGNAQVPLAELFDIAGDGSDSVVILEGDLSHLNGIGTGMTSGHLVVRGSLGARVGSQMSGGEIDVSGSVGPWAGAEMRGGILRILGDAGDNLGSALPGSRVGMREGLILVSGSVGIDAGLAMRRGWIVIGGDSGEAVGRGLVAGSIFVFGKLGRLAGVGMKRGTIVGFGGGEAIAPTFAPSGRWRPHFLNIYLKELATQKFDFSPDVFSGQFDRYNGDLAGRGQGEILARTP